MIWSEKRSYANTFEIKEQLKTEIKFNNTRKKLCQSQIISQGYLKQISRIGF